MTDAERRWRKSKAKSGTFGVRSRGRVSDTPTISISFIAYAGETVAWSRIDDPFVYLVDGPTGTGSTITGTDSGTLLIRDVTALDDDEYLFWVLADNGQMEPVNSTVVSVEPDVADVTHSPMSREVCEGGTTTFRIDAIGATGFRWSWNGRRLTDGVLPTDSGPDVLVAGAATSELTLIGVTPEAAGQITAVIEDNAGPDIRPTEIFPFYLTVSNNSLPPQIITQPEPMTRVTVGADVELVCEALASDPNSVQSYQWCKDGTPIFGDGRVFGTNFPDLLIENVELSDAGVYDCVVTQACGTVTSLPAVLTVSCPADTNGDGSVDPSDFNAWVLAYNSQSPACDQNGDGLCTPADFNAWVLNFNAGC
ncbi:MAG: immunoglobulin domain-containing protein [Planctomycetota bacterium]